MLTHLDSQHRITLSTSFVSFLSAQLSMDLEELIAVQIDNHMNRIFFKPKSQMDPTSRCYAFRKLDTKTRIILPEDIITAIGANQSSSFSIYIENETIYLEKMKEEH